MAEQADLLPGTLDVLILKSVSLGPLHGYAVLRAHRADHAGRAAGRTGRALPGPLPAGAPGAPRHRVGHVRQQPAREVLQPHRGGTETAPRGNRKLEPSGRGDVGRAQGAPVRGLRRRHAETILLVLARGAGPRHLRTRHGRRDPVPRGEPHGGLDSRRPAPRGSGAPRARASSARWRSTRKSPARASASGWSTKRWRARYALRTFARNRTFTATAIVTLALGIGANTAIFSLMDALMLRWLPVAESSGAAAGEVQVRITVEAAAEASRTRSPRAGR